MSSTHATSTSTTSGAAAAVMVSPLSPLPFWKQVIAGGVAGCLETSINYPIDLVKTRHQLNRGQAMSTLSTLRELTRPNGMIGLYRGILSPLAAETPVTAVKFSACAQYKRWLSDDAGYLAPQRAWIAGALAGCTESLVSCPFEVVKIRMQSTESRQMYRNTPACAAHLVRHEGIIGLYRGLEALLWRNGIWNSCYFGVAASIRHYWPHHQHFNNNNNDNAGSKSAELVYEFTVGAISGGVATTFNTPFDGIKSRLQAQRKATTLVAGTASTATATARGTSTTGVTIYNWCWPGLLTMYRQEGFKSLYRGYAPRMLRLVPGGGIMLLAYDQMTILLRPL